MRPFSSTGKMHCVSVWGWWDGDKFRQLDGEALGITELAAASTLAIEHGDSPSTVNSPRCMALRRDLAQRIQRA
eukprot:CAMPEP_0118911170 /NCGR_PEP_ID=MMETSP1166-20130328/12985_1 /TAXON_ID=1104430 /ORGANISM="Chrysoreinhardia sp, Strain CCMP3193" /LENGTH=73 /DNA_ID=CAMNT_0006850647 /DNA_START=205 /DNA_END=426 /DNA_ORIENTATION=-